MCASGWHWVVNGGHYRTWVSISVAMEISITIAAWLWLLKNRKWCCFERSSHRRWWDWCYSGNTSLTLKTADLSNLVLCGLHLNSLLLQVFFFFFQMKPLFEEREKDIRFRTLSHSDNFVLFHSTHTLFIRQSITLSLGHLFISH